MENNSSIKGILNPYRFIFNMYMFLLQYSDFNNMINQVLFKENIEA